MHDDNKLDLGERVYYFRGGVWPALDENKNPHPKAGKEWCFTYAESNWKNPKPFREDGEIVRYYNILDYWKDAVKGATTKEDC